MKKATSWDSEENEALNSYIAWNEIGDYILGTLVSKKVVPNKLAKDPGTMQNIYEVKVKDCSYHVLDDKKKLVAEPIIPEVGSIISVGGRKTIDSRMAHIKRGQVFGLKFTEEVPSKTKGYNDTKVIKVYTPKNDAGEYEMDEEFLAQDNTDAEEAMKKM